MKIYISVDMEGISGISHPDHVRSDCRLYAEGRILMTEDTNAAIRGAFDGGADEVIVADMHGGANNLIVSDLDPRALVLEGAPRVPRFAFLDKKVNGLFLVGYHAMNGTLRANLEHTMTSASWHRHCINGRVVGELGIDAILAAEAGVPVVMVSGDDKLCAEAREFLGGAVETACTKQGVSRQQALLLSVERGRQAVYEHAKRAVERLVAGEKFPMMQTAEKYTVSTTYKMVHDADDAANMYGARRIDGYTVEMDYPRLADMHGGLWSDFDIEQTVH